MINLYSDTQTQLTPEIRRAMADFWRYNPHEHWPLTNGLSVTTIHTRSRVGPDGRVVVAVGAQDAGKDVFVTVVPAPPPMTREEWLRFVEQTAGSITDPTFERQPQGSHEDRETFES